MKKADFIEAEEAIREVLGGTSFWMRTPWVFKQVQLRYPHIYRHTLATAWWHLRGSGEVVTEGFTHQMRSKIVR